MPFASFARINPGGLCRTLSILGVAIDVAFHATILTLYPEMFPGHLGHSLAGEALKLGLWSLEARNIRDHGIGKHRTVDDTPAGGGPGMVLRADVLAAAIDAVGADERSRLLMSPRGKPLAQNRIREIAAGPGAVILCGRFEGVDERIIAARSLEEISIGDYVLSGGEPAALTLLDAVVRLIPGVMGKSESGMSESFETGLLEYPHYTRPREFEGQPIPDVLLSGDHAKIDRWRAEQARRLTAERRPDLLAIPSGWKDRT
jgi:tRNA (guanine37-N1)-methyltransferase